MSESLTDLFNYVNVSFQSEEIAVVYYDGIKDAPINLSYKELLQNAELVRIFNFKHTTNSF